MCDHRIMQVKRNGVWVWMPAGRVMRDIEEKNRGYKPPKDCGGECGAKNIGFGRCRACEYTGVTGNA